jgi:hypothetical protein
MDYFWWAANYLEYRCIVFGFVVFWLRDDGVMMAGEQKQKRTLLRHLESITVI